MVVGGEGLRKEERIKQVRDSVHRIYPSARAVVVSSFDVLVEENS